MKIKQLRFEKWGTLHGTANLDPGKVSVLLVDTDRERTQLEAALSALLTGATSDARGEGGALEAVLEGGDKPLVWHVDGRDTARPAPAGGLSARFSGVADRRFRARGDGPPWVVPAAELARGGDLESLNAWLRLRVDAPGGGRTGEEVARALDRHGGAPAREALQQVDAELQAVDRELAALDAAQADAAAHLERADRLAAVHARMAPIVAALKDPELRRRLGELERRLFTHRAAHRRVKALGRELAKLACPLTVEELDRLAHDLDVYESAEEPRALHEEAAADLAAARARAAEALGRRAWADRLTARAVEDVGRLAGRLEGVEAQVRELEVAVAHAEADNPAARRIAALAPRVGAVTASERDLVRASLVTTTQGRETTQRMTGQLADTRRRLDRVHSVQSQLRWMVGAVGAAGALVACAVSLSSWQRINGLPANPLAISGGVIAALAAGICATAGSLVSTRRGTLEAEVAALAVPLELEQLRLSLAGFKIGEVCSRHGYDDPVALATDLEDYDRLTARRDVRPYMQSRVELARLRAEELTPLEAEAHALIDACGLPHPDTNPAATLRRAWSELQVHSIGTQWAATLDRAATRAAAARDELCALQAERLISLRDRLARAGILGLEGARPALAALETAARRRHDIEHRDRPALTARLLSRADLRALVRERRAIRKPLAADLNLSERQLARAAAAVTAAAAEAQRGLADVYRRRPRLRRLRADLLDRRERLASRIAAATSSQRALDAALVLGRGPAARLLNSAAMPRWSAGARFGDDLALHLPLAATLDPDLDPVRARLAIRAGIAATAGTGPHPGVPLVLVEPFEGFDAGARSALVDYLTTHIAPSPQVLIVSRLRSRWEHVRWAAPRVFPKLQLISV